jgi:hypothetical protein
MSRAVAIDIPSLIRRETQKRQPSQCLTKRYQLPEYYYPSYLQHPNQPFSSPSLSVSSSPSSSSLSSYDQEECEEESIVNESSSAISVDGEFDMRIEMIRPSPEQKIHSQIQRSRPGPASPASPNVIAGVRECACASAPPLSEDEFENENANDYPQPQPQQPQQQKPQQQKPQQQQPQQQKQEKEEEVCVCVICYETFEEPVELIRGRNYTSEELEEIEGKEKITNFCQTCKYDVHHKCIDEYRLTKMTDVLRSGYQRGYVQSPDIAGTFGMKCLLCSKEVEKIHISMDGEVNIVKIQPGANEQNRQQQQEQQQQIEEIMRHRMQRRLRRRQRLQFCKNKICTICFMFLVAVTLLVLVFRVI